MAEFPKSYNSEEAEKKWYEAWVGKGYFKPT
jgi:valyl-tRNA synthetase